LYETVWFFLSMWVYARGALPAQSSCHAVIVLPKYFGSAGRRRKRSTTPTTMIAEPMKSFFIEVGLTFLVRKGCSPTACRSHLAVEI
jgi:hypothetical protein